MHNVTWLRATLSGVLLIGMTCPFVGCAAEPDAGKPSVEPVTTASADEPLTAEAELQDAFDNAACYCEAYVVKPTDVPTNPAARDWVANVDSGACGDPKLASYAAKYTLQDRQQAKCFNKATAVVYQGDQRAPNLGGPSASTQNGCFDSQPQDLSATKPSPGFCRADFNYCLGQQLRLKADSLARPPSSTDARAAILAEARHRFEMSGSEHAYTLEQVDKRTASPCVGDACFTYLGTTSASEEDVFPITETCKLTNCIKKQTPSCSDPPCCQESCTVSPTATQAASRCALRETARRSQLLTQTPDTYDYLVSVTRSLVSTPTEYRCVLNVTYPTFQQDATPKERTRVQGGYGDIATARIADATSQVSELLEAGMTDRIALSDGARVTDAAYASQVWGPSGQRTLALKSLAGARTPRPGAEPPVPVGMARDGGPRRALALLEQYKIPVPYERCATSEGWEALDAAGASAWATSAFQQLGARVAADLSRPATEAALLLEREHAVGLGDVRGALDLLRDRIATMNVDHTFVTPADAASNACARTYVQLNSPLIGQRDPLVIASAIADGVPAGQACGLSILPTTQQLEQAGGAQGLDVLRRRVRDLRAAPGAVAAWSQNPSLGLAARLTDGLLGKTWTSYGGCFWPGWCASGTWTIAGDVAALASAQIVLARSEDEVSCLARGYMPGRAPGSGCRTMDAYSLAATTLDGVTALTFTAPFNGFSSTDRAFLVARTCQGLTCSHALVDVVYPQDWGARHVLGGSLLASAGATLAKSAGNPAEPQKNSLGLDNAFLPPLANALDSQGNTQAEGFVRSLGEARQSAAQASSLLDQARQLEISYLVGQQEINLARDGAALAENDVVVAACGTDTPCNVARAPRKSLAQLGIVPDPGAEPAGYGTYASCTGFLRSARFSITDVDDKKAYVRGFLGAQLRCVRWATMKMASQIELVDLPQRVVDELITNPDGTNPNRFTEVGGSLRQEYLDLFAKFLELKVALRQFDALARAAGVQIDIAVAQIDEQEPSTWDKISCVASRSLRALATVAATTAAVLAPPAAGAGASYALFERFAQGASIGNSAAFGLETASGMSSCWSEAAAADTGRRAWAGTLDATEKMKALFDDSVRLIGVVASADAALDALMAKVALAAEKRDLETRIAQNAAINDPASRALQGKRVEDARRTLRDAQRLGFAARRAIELRTASDLRWMTDPGFVGGAPSSWANDIFLVDQAYIGGGGVAHVAAEAVTRYADELEAFVDHYPVSHAFAVGHDRTVLNLREMLGGSSWQEAAQYKCAGHPEPLAGGHLPSVPSTGVPCDGLGGVESVSWTFGVPATMSGYVATRIAQGNRNYRVRRLGVNLDAPGFFDCSVAASPFECASDATVRYTLRQDGLAGIDNLDGEYRYYALSDGVIQDARGLAAERILPDDAAIAPYERDEWRGRPFAGLYTLTIRSRPEMSWAQLQNVQLQVEYEYWTPQN